jgi:hypothetical protein
MVKRRFVFGGGPVPGVPGRLFVAFVEPARADAATFYGDDPQRILQDVQAAYANDMLTALPPFGVLPAGDGVDDAMAGIVAADIAELAFADAYRGIADANALRRLCRAALDFVAASGWKRHGLFVAALQGAGLPEAEVAVVGTGQNDAGFTLYPGRGGFALMGQTGPAPMLSGDLLAFGIRALPDWVAAAASAACTHAVAPDPARIRNGIRILADDADALLLAAVATAIARDGEGEAGGVRARLRRWRS